jgi:hypothetical protein
VDDHLKEHLKSLESAGSRSRYVVIALVVACVLGFMGFLNSCMYGWIAQRAGKVARDNKYAEMRLRLINSFKEEMQSVMINEKHPEWPREQAARLSQALIKEYAEDGFKNRIPFFGAVLDVYDLGLVGGLGYSTILLLLFYSFNSETTALRLAFSAAEQLDGNALKDFYAILVTRQVFSIPKTEAITDITTPSDKGPWDNHWTFQWLRLLPKTLVAFPVVVYIFIVAYDFSTWKYGWYISPVHTVLLVVYSLFFTSLIVCLFVQCWRRLSDIDQIWDFWHKRIMASRRPPRDQTKGADG